MRYFLCLGSNIGNKSKNLEQALHLLEKEGSQVVKKSSIYETEPIDSPGQPWFLNQVVEVSTELKPLDLLTALKKIERQMGRKPTAQNEPRVIDVDILLAGKAVIRTKELEIPHPRMEKRNFVLIPLKEISPGTIHPRRNVSIEYLWKKSKDNSAVKKFKDQKLSLHQK